MEVKLHSANREGGDADTSSRLDDRPPRTMSCGIGGYHVSPGTIILMSQWLLHRDPKLFDAPFEFTPERWKERFEASPPKISYFHFGGGLRRCIGENFALMELVFAA